MSRSRLTACRLLRTTAIAPTRTREQEVRRETLYRYRVQRESRPTTTYDAYTVLAERTEHIDAAMIRRLRNELDAFVQRGPINMPPRWSIEPGAEERIRATYTRTRFVQNDQPQEES